MEKSRMSKTIDKLEPREAEIGKLSPTCQSYLQKLVQKLRKGEAILKTDKDGNLIIGNQVQKIPCRKKAPSSHHEIVVPKSEADKKRLVQKCLKLFDCVKNNKNLRGVLLDHLKIRLKEGEYREGTSFEYTRTNQILGRGWYGGDIIVVKDNNTGEIHALKIINITDYHRDEIECWLDLSDSGYVPKLYLFQMKDKTVEFHMEILCEAHTMQSIIESLLHNGHLHKLDPSLRKALALYILIGSLEAESAMNGHNWVHKDLHEGNIMLQKSEEEKPKVKFLDFGRSSKYDDPVDTQGFRSDIRNILGMCCSIFGGRKINNFHQLDWVSEIDNQLPVMSVTNKYEVRNLVKLAMNVVHPADVMDYRIKVKKMFHKALEKMKKTETDFLEEVVEILFPEAKQKQDPVQLDEANGIEDSSCVRDRKIQFKKASNYKTSGPTVVTEELNDNLQRSMSI